MEYLFLAIAIVGELAGTTFIKYSEGFTKPLPSIICAAAYIISFYCFSKALLNMNLSIAYATWCGVGIVVTSVISVLIFRQAITGWGVLGISLILVGTVLVNLFGTPAV